MDMVSYNSSRTHVFCKHDYVSNLYIISNKIMKRGVRKRAGENLSPANIRRVIHSLNEEGITKKVACEMLNISYNTTRLNRIIEEFE